MVAPYNAQVRCLREKLPARGRGRDGRQVPGPAGAGRLLRDGELELGRRPARPRLPLLAQPPQRRDLASPVPRVPGLLTAPARRELPDGRADAPGKRPLPSRRTGRACVGAPLLFLDEGGDLDGNKEAVQPSAEGLLVPRLAELPGRVSGCERGAQASTVIGWPFRFPNPSTARLRLIRSRAAPGSSAGTRASARSSIAETG